MCQECTAKASLTKICEKLQLCLQILVLQKIEKFYLRNMYFSLISPPCKCAIFNPIWTSWPRKVFLNFHKEKFVLKLTQIFALFQLKILVSKEQLLIWNVKLAQQQISKYAAESNNILFSDWNWIKWKVVDDSFQQAIVNECRQENTYASCCRRQLKCVKS